MIAVSNLSFTYSNASKIAFPDFSVNPGSHIVILGESGSGKTTLLYLLGGLLRNYTGNIYIENTSLETMNEHALDKFRGQHIGFVFQRHHLIQALTVEQNLMMPAYLAGLPVDEKRIEDVLTQLSIFEKRRSKISQLSQGQAQRVAIARAVINKPAIILADEPTSALDDKNCDKVIQLLFDAAERSGSTLLIATHDQRLKTKIENQIVLQ